MKAKEGDGFFTNLKPFPPTHMKILTLGGQQVFLVVGHNFVFLKPEEEELA